MLLWRVWFARNEVTHAKPLPSVEGSLRFLSGYMSTLLDLEIDPLIDPVKGKQMVQDFKSMAAKPAKPLLS